MAAVGRAEGQEKRSSSGIGRRKGKLARAVASVTTLVGKMLEKSRSSHLPVSSQNFALVEPTQKAEAKEVHDAVPKGSATQG